MIFLPTSGGRGNASRPEKNQWAKKQPADRPAIIAAVAATAAVETEKNLPKLYLCILFQELLSITAVSQILVLSYLS